MAFSIVGLNRQGVNVVKHVLPSFKLKITRALRWGENQVNAVMIDCSNYIPNFLAEKNPQVPWQITKQLAF